jgi:hypothetical protein
MLDPLKIQTERRKNVHFTECAFLLGEQVTGAG